MIDLTDLNKARLTPGSTVFIISTSKYYMLNGSKNWIEINPFGKTVIIGDSGEEIPPEEPDNDDIIYDGGVV